MNKLEQYFIEQFKKLGIEEAKKSLLNVKNRYNIITTLSENPEEAKDFNDNYEKTFDKVYKIYKNDQKIKQKEVEKVNNSLQSITDIFFYIIYWIIAIVFIAFNVTIWFIKLLSEIFLPTGKKRKKR